MLRGKKRQSLSISEKMKIFSFVDQNPNMRQVQVAEKFGIPTSSLSTFLKERRSIEAQALQVNVKRKRIREPKFADLEGILTEWFHQQRAQNIPIDGIVLRIKAKEIALQVEYEGFTASNGWISRFLDRQELKFKKISGESEAVESATVDTWKNDVLPNLLKNYAPKDRFNADELGLFFNLVPDKSMAHRTETCHGGKRSKERVTILLACNQDGSEKLKPLMIGKSRSPRCFKNIRHLPCEYSSNRKAWMTAEECKQWLKKLDAKMRAQRRKILLLLDNCPAHPKDLDFLTNVRVEFLPPNTTSHTQPLDMGIIKVVKHHYRQKLVRRLLNLLSRGEELEPKDWRINLYQAMHYLFGSWDAITPATIQNCFRKAGFEQQPAGDEPSTSAQSDDNEAELDPNSAIDCPRASFAEVTERWEEVQKLFESTSSFEDFVAADDFTPVCQLQTMEEIISMLRKETEENPDDPGDSDSNEDEDADGETPRPVLRSEAMEALEVFRRYAGQLSGGDPEDIFRMINKLENLTISATTQHLKQASLDSYFFKK